MAQGRVELPTRPAEIDRVLAAADPGIRLLVTVVAATGMRRDEALHLRWGDVDFREGRIDVRAKRYRLRRRDRSEVQVAW